MTTTVPLAEFQAVAARSMDVWTLGGDPSVGWVRFFAAELREQDDRDVADDLDALADRYEKMAQ
jgi:hypothetical protein